MARRRTSTEVTRHYYHQPGGPSLTPVAVARRSYFEANSFEIVQTPSMKILAQGFDDLAQAEYYAENINRENKRTNAK